MDILGLISQLLRPWAYLRINASGKAWFDWIVPFVAAVALSAIILQAGETVAVFNEGGLVRQITGFLQNLPGFFIAALAAVATFNRDDLDSLLPAPTPTMVVTKRGHSFPLELTRRRFLCALFAFLTAQTLLIICMGIFATSLAAWVVQAAPPALLCSIRGAGTFLFMFLLSQLLAVTSLGLYYLGDRIHVPD